MDSKRIEDIERLLQKMREENLQYRENKQNLYSKTLENDEDDDDFVIESRYKEPKKEKLPEKDEKFQIVQESEEESSDVEEKAKERLKKRLDELKNKRNNLGPPVRVKEDSSSSDSTPPNKPVRPLSRPTTAKVIPSYIQTPFGKKKRNDPVALYQQRQREWKSNSFLKANNLNTREGRKLNLNPSYHQKTFELNKKKDVHEFIRNDYTAPHEKRRDDVRFSTRVKMMSASDVQ
jgi:hypothetical protein